MSRDAMVLLVRDKEIQDPVSSPEGYQRLFDGAIDVDSHLRQEDLQRQGTESLFLAGELFSVSSSLSIKLKDDVISTQIASSRVIPAIDTALPIVSRRFRTTDY
jgi:hypothetical protein